MQKITIIAEETDENLGKFYNWLYANLQINSYVEFDQISITVEEVDE